MSQIATLPTAYNLVTLDTVDSVVEEAKRRAADGADEGLLVWAREQRAEGLSQPLEVALPSAFLEGRFLDLDLEGNLILQDDTGQRNSLSAARIFNATN